MSGVPHQSLPQGNLNAGNPASPTTWRLFASKPWDFQAAMVALLLLPAALFYARAIADGLLSITALLFLYSRWALRDRSWLRPLHVRLALAFWAWQLVCTVLTSTPHEIGEALAVIRLFLFAAALEFWLLPDIRQRRLLSYAIGIAVAWLIIESWQQYFFGSNVFGNPRWGSGVLTGPFNKPRAAAVLQMLYFVVFLPPALYLLQRPGMWRRLASALLLTASVICLAVIGQRMPVLLVLFGLCIAAVVARPLRASVAIALLIVAAALAAAQIVSPMTYHTLIVVFLRRMEHFWSTPYAVIYQRAAVMIQQHPWLGLGFDGYRDHCQEARYIRTLSWLPVTALNDPIACTIHPHNYWLQLASSSGLIGAALFATLCVVWLVRIGQGMLRETRPLQVAVFVTVCTMFWPIASTTDLFTLPNAGWVFLLIGWGLAEQYHTLRPMPPGP